MANVLVIVELDSESQLKKGSLSALTFAKQASPAFGGTVDALVLGANTAAAAAAIATHGVGRVITVEDASFTNYLAENFAPTVAEVGKRYSLLVATATSFGKDLMPRVAAKLDAAYAGDCAGVRVEGGKALYRRPMYAGNAFGSCSLETPIQVATVRQSEVAPDAANEAPAPIEKASKVASSGAAARVEFVSLEEVKSARPALSDAKVIVSGGRALKEKFFPVLEPLAVALGAAPGASRAAVDAGYCPGDYQVGQTGKIVAPSLYVAVGNSGAIQHIAGMKGSKVIVAINKDADAPIFQLADYGLVADLFEAVPALVAALK